MKIGFFTYLEYSLSSYHQMLKKRAECIWAIHNRYLFRDLKQRTKDKVVFLDNPIGVPLPYFLNRLVNKTWETFYASPSVSVYQRLVNKVDADIWLTDAIYPILKVKLSVPRVIVFHSIAFKKHILDPATTEYDLILLPSQYFHDELLRKYPDLNPRKLVVVGWPRVDIFKKPPYSRSETLSKLGLNPSQKTVLFAPTFGLYSGGRFFPEHWGDLEENFESICKTLKTKNLNFIIKLHSGSVDLVEKKVLHRIAKKHGALWLNQQNKYYVEDPREILFATDLLISDVSGITNEFLPLDRPIIYVDVNNELFWEQADIPKEYRAGDCVRNRVELLEAIDDNLTSPTRHGDKRKQLQEKLFLSLDGQSTQRACEAILNFMGAKYYDKHAN